MTKKTNKKEENKLSGISIGFSIGSLFIAAIPLGIIAFILALMALGKDEEKGLKALILSIVLPMISFIISLMILASL